MSKDKNIITMPLTVFHVGDTGVVLKEDIAPSAEHFQTPAHFVFMGKFDLEKDERLTLTVTRQ